MDAKQLIQTMMKDSGTTGVGLSRAMGKTDGFVSATLARGSVPKVDTFAAMADAMGYEVVVRGHGREYRVGGVEGRAAR